MPDQIMLAIIPQPELMMGIRKARTTDAAALLPLFPLAFPDGANTLRQVKELLNAAALLLVAEVNGAVVGFAAALPVPGLPDQVDLGGAVAIGWQRQGIGSALLKALVEEGRRQGFRTITYALDDSQDPSAPFLHQCGFTLHHEEWELFRSGDLAVPVGHLPDGWERRRGVGDAAAPLFRQLYDASFGPHPWFQPYSDEELHHLFRQQGLPHFLWQGEQPVGFIWAWVDDGIGIVEPVGVIPSHQGRGLGRQLLLLALHDFQQQAVSQVKIGAWRENAAALHLYQSLGFRHTHTITHLQLSIDH